MVKSWVPRCGCNSGGHHSCIYNVHRHPCNRARWWGWVWSGPTADTERCPVLGGDAFAADGLLGEAAAPPDLSNQSRLSGDPEHCNNSLETLLRQWPDDTCMWGHTCLSLTCAHAYAHSCTHAHAQYCRLALLLARICMSHVFFYEGHVGNDSQAILFSS